MTVGKRTLGALTVVETSCGNTAAGYREYRLWRGDNSPNLQAKRENPYYCEIEIRNEPLIKWGQRGQYTGTVSGCFGGGANFPQPSQGTLDAMRSQSLKQVLGKYKLHDFNMATFLGELPETVNMVADSALAIYRSYRAVRKGRFGEAVKILRDINLSRSRRFAIDKYASSNWLALRYGWMPLIGDAYSAVEAYESITKDRPRGSTFRGRSKYVCLPRSKEVGPSSRDVYYDQVVLRTEVKPTPLQSLGFLDPELVAWELIPFSFVVDWFVDVGSYLEMRAVLPRFQCTYILTTKEHSLCLGYKNTSYYAKVDVPDFRIELIIMNRSIQKNVSVPPPRISNPLAIKSFMARLADINALGIALIHKYLTR